MDIEIFNQSSDAPKTSAADIFHAFMRLFLRNYLAPAVVARLKWNWLAEMASDVTSMPSCTSDQEDQEDARGCPIWLTESRLLENKPVQCQYKVVGESADM